MEAKDIGGRAEAFEEKRQRRNRHCPQFTGAGAPVIVYRQNVNEPIKLERYWRAPTGIRLASGRLLRVYKERAVQFKPFGQGLARVRLS